MTRTRRTIIVVLLAILALIAVTPAANAAGILYRCQYGYSGVEYTRNAAKVAWLNILYGHYVCLCVPG